MLLAGLLVFAPLYGCPALLIREVTRRAGRGWPSMILLAAAFGVLQPGVVDQSMFSAGYRGIPGWDESVRPTYVEALGLGAYQAQSFVLGHVVYSFCAPIAVAEALRPRTARRTWLDTRWLWLALVLYLSVAGLVLRDALSAGASHASPAQVAGTLAVAALSAVAAFALPPSPAPEVGASPAGRAPGPRVGAVLAAALLLSTVYSVLPATWTGTVLVGVVVTVSGVLLVRYARRPGWGIRHSVAVAFGVILCRGLLAFTYYPVIGEVTAVRKYGHNLGMLVIVSAACCYALSRASERRGAVEGPP